MKCPHCLVEFHPQMGFEYIGKDAEDDWAIEYALCPSEDCGKLILFLIGGTKLDARGRGGRIIIHPVKSKTLVRPKGISRIPIPPEVPKPLANDYREACLVLADSPKASAALSRRCLQTLLRDAAEVKHGELSEEIQQVLESGKLPTHLAEAIDAVRNVGNFAAHPVKSRSSGEIVEVEPGEAEWNLDTLEGLFDFYFVSPAHLKKKRDALNKKLQDAGKPPMKGGR